MEQWTGETVVIWGDSLAKGVVWNEARKRHAYSKVNAASIVAERLGIRIINRAKFGCTAKQGMELLERDVEEGITCDAALIEFGGNDCNFDWTAISERPDETHLPATSPEAYLQSMQKMVEHLLSKGIRPVLMTLPPIDAERYFTFLVGDTLNRENILRWLGDVQQIYRYQEMYSLLAEKVAREYSIRLIDIRSRCLAEKSFYRDMLCEDGLHLTEAGQRFVGEQIADLVRIEEGRKAM
jgi:lysophospholipase L1-like esterase